MSRGLTLIRLHLTSLAFALLGGGVSAAPAEFWEDRGVKVIQTTEMRFPASLLLEGITHGAVRTVLEVDADGKLADFLITGYTHRELALELQRSLATFEFTPARQRGEPIRCRFEVLFSFEAHGAVLSLSPMSSMSAYLRDAITDPMLPQVARTTELDQPLAAVEQPSPRHPGKALSPPVHDGRVQVDFYIDGDGRPRMPVVLRATREEFAVAAIEALLQWRFAPPTRAGRPVAVRVVQEFRFTPEPAGESRSS